MDHAISVIGLTKRYEDVTALDSISLEVEKGELYGLLGPNGAGKTTAINILTGILKPTDGSATVGGYDVLRNGNKVKELIGVGPQDAPTIPYLTGRENIELFGNLHNMPKVEMNRRIDVLLEKMSLSDLLRTRDG